MHTIQHVLTQQLVIVISVMMPKRDSMRQGGFQSLDQWCQAVAIAIYWGSRYQEPVNFGGDCHGTFRSLEEYRTV